MTLTTLSGIALPSNRSLVYGYGINDVFEKNFSKTVCYKKWADLVRRCCQPRYKEKYPMYKDCTIDPTWLYASAFKEWIETWDDYESKAIDKDIKIPGNTHYSPETCLMVTQKINAWFKPTDIVGSHGDLSLPRGVSEKSGKYRAQVNIVNGPKAKHLGFFKTPEEASVVYDKARKEQILVLMEEESDPRVKNALLQYTI